MRHKFSKKKSSNVPIRRFSTVFSVEMERCARGVVCTMRGVRSILVYEDTCMGFAFEKEALYLHGHGLMCRTYGNGYVRVSGEIMTIEIKEGSEQ